MTSAAPLVYYPQYCFHLSPTINKWCPLRAIDIASLQGRSGFEDIDVFFYLNHPIRWVRIIGVVVAIDDYYGHRVYTIDDSTGECIECSLAVSNPVFDKLNRRGNDNGQETERHASPTKRAIVAHTTDAINTKNAVPTTSPSPDIDVGMVVEIKGSVKLFRGQRQIKIQKVIQILSTNQEVLFWDKIRDFRRDVLSQPWALNDREVRRCLRLQQVEAADPGKKKPRKKVEGESEGAGKDRVSGSGRIHVSESRRTAKDSLAGASVKMAKAQRAARTESLRARAGDGNQYGALGL